MHISSSIYSLSLSQKTPRVLLLQTEWNDRVYRGVARFATEQGWILDAPQRWAHDLPYARENERDGIIVQIGEGPNRDKLLRFIRHASVPVVDLQGDDALGAAPRVLISNAGIAWLAVEHFAKRGFSRFCFVAWRNSPAELQLSQALLADTRTAGCSCETVHLDDLPQAMKNLQRPFALVAANDLIASTVIHICSLQDLEVPEDVVVLGIGDDDVLCTAGPIGISSVDCNFEEQGYAAGRLMDGLMKGEVVQSDSVMIEPCGVTERLSTDTIAVTDKETAKVLRYLRDNYTRQLETEGLAHICGAPGSRTWSSFRKQVGRTVMQELMRLRIRRAQALLADEKLRLADIAQQCGFISRYHFERRFIRLMGCTPRSYRRKLLFPDEEQLPDLRVYSVSKTARNLWAC